MLVLFSFRLNKAALPQFVVVVNGFISQQRTKSDLFKKSLRNQFPETSSSF